MARGYCYWMQNEFGMALEDETRSINKFKNNPRAYFIGGACKFHLHDINGAESDLGAALNIDHKNAAAFNYMAAVKLQKQDYKEALENYSAVIKIDSTFPDVFTTAALYAIISRISRSHHRLQCGPQQNSKTSLQ